MNLKIMREDELSILKHDFTRKFLWNENPGRRSEEEPSLIVDPAASLLGLSGLINPSSDSLITSMTKRSTR